MDKAFIHENAKIGANVQIDPFSYIAGDVEIGDGTWIGPNVTIMDGARIGKNCKIFPGAVISAIPQDLKFEGEKSTAEIGDNTTIRECVTVNRGTKDRNKTVVGSNCLLMAYVHIAHDVFVGNHVILANTANIAGHVTIEDFAILEGVVAVQQFITIGAHSFIAGGSLVRKNVPPFVKAAREPLTYAGINAIGLRRRGFKPEQISQIEDIYREIFVRGHNVSKSLNEISESFSDSDAKKSDYRVYQSISEGYYSRSFKLIMNIELTDIGKRFKRDWIFRHLDFKIKKGEKTGLIGPNGSGKSTLLKIISQAEIPSEGKVLYSFDGETIKEDKAFQKLSFAAPYIDLPEQLTLKELFDFHVNFQPLIGSLGLEEFLKLIYLQDAAEKQILYFSSGMKQRLKLGLAISSDCPLLLLDEPCSNLDEKGVEFYHQLLKQYTQNKTILIGSNEVEKEIGSNFRAINLMDYK
jgi:UDP-N-acetylglucosamine acyltransferase